MPSRRQQIDASAAASFARHLEVRSLQPGPIDEQACRLAGQYLLAGRVLSRLRHRQRWHPVREFALDAQALPARDEQREPGAAPQQEVSEPRAAPRAGARRCPATAATVAAPAIPPPSPARSLPDCSVTPRAFATAWAMSVESPNAASSTSQTPCAYSSSIVPATCSASRVLPQPPAPDSVSSRVVPSHRLTCGISRSRPMKLVSGCGRLCLGGRAGATAAASRVTSRLKR